MIRVLLAALLIALASAGGAHAQDFEREARWRSEVVPGLVAGEAVDIPGPGGKAFLGLLTEPAGADRSSTTLLVLVHGIGVHPDHGIIGRLRMDLADKGYATLAIQGGAPLLNVSRQLRHGDIGITAKVSVHAVPGGNKVAADIMEHILAGNQAQPPRNLVA